ncbi:hypothetical protein DC366_18265 [Pelagivirga sediminicola]|uniref:DUF2061 domain-containing protein n=2 Tax=Pelagivirga sediminicola TaxID=2170575 RepID=A0A2T7G2H6_9RHOB|nr:hypothetical protein DC366_18265 [Pelagivirga sediminicola]
MAVSWRIIGTFDTLVLSWLVITYIGPLFGHLGTHSDALQAATYIAITEVITKTVLYFLHERGWARVDWGVSTENSRRKESGWRSTSKTATWRITASLDTTLLAWIFSGNLGTAVSIGGIEVFTKLILYFFHERMWSRIQYGITPPVADPDAVAEEDAPHPPGSGGHNH